MTRCSSHDIGKYLHAFELNQLSDDKRMAFEEHILSCDYCFEEVSRFDETARLLNSDSDIRQLIQMTAKTEKFKGIINSIKNVVWPKGQPILLRPVVTYIVLALMIYPAYLGLNEISEPEVRSTQTIVMTDTRGTTQTNIDATKPLSLVFRVSGANSKEILVVLLKDDKGKIIYNDLNFTSLSESKLGTISFNENILSSGQYYLTISNQSESPLVEYTFRVE